MRQSTVEHVLRLIGSDHFKSSGAEWLMARCPLASIRHAKGTDTHPSLGVHIGSGPSFVRCHACDFRGTLYRLVRETRSLGLIDDDVVNEALLYCRRGEKYEVPLTDDVVTIKETPVLDDEVRERLRRWHPYFRERRLTREDTERWWLGYGDRTTIYLPCVLSSGEVPYVQVRTVPPEERAFWWLPRGGFTRQHVIGSHLIVEQRCIIAVEGMFDAIRVDQLLREKSLTKRFAVVALFGSDPGSFVARHLISLVRDELILCPDNDEAGRIWADALEESIQQQVPRLSRMVLPARRKDPGEAKRRELFVSLVKRENAFLRRLNHTIERQSQIDSPI